MSKILFIYSENCRHCQEALSLIEKAVAQRKDISCEIMKFHYDTKEAVTIAINNGIDDLPGFVIGKSVFVGKNYSEEKIVEAVKKLK